MRRRDNLDDITLDLNNWYKDANLLALRSEDVDELTEILDRTNRIEGMNEREKEAHKLLISAYADINEADLHGKTIPKHANDKLREARRRLIEELQG